MSSSTAPADRARLVARLRRSLLRRDWPRVQMAAIVAVTGASGFLASVALLRTGLERIPLRYLAALGVAYAVFLSLLYFWIRLRRPSSSSNSGRLDPGLGADISGLSSGDILSPGGGSFTAGGGEFGGAGASASWGAADASSSSGAGTGGDWSFDADDAGVVLALAAAAAVLFGASVWVVATAPTLFAELLLDGALSAILYRRLRRNWLESAVRRTAAPFLLAAILLAGAGFAMERYAPDARSLGAVWNRLTR